MESYRFLAIIVLAPALTLAGGCYDNPPPATAPNSTSTNADENQDDEGKLTIGHSPDATGTYEVAVPESTSIAGAGDPSSGLGSETAADVQDSVNSDNIDHALVASGPKQPPLPIPSSWKKLFPEHEVWLDKAKRQVIVGGQICFNEGPLEMLICPRGTKEHESIISAKAESWQVHAALKAAGHQEGKPCQWAPEYQPAWGPKINIDVMWVDARSGETKTADSKQWILNIVTKKTMQLELVFGGSLFEKNPETGNDYYTADSGPLICLANFATATVDLRITDPDTQAFFEANTPAIPPLGAQVYAVIRVGETIGKPDAK